MIIVRICVWYLLFEEFDGFKGSKNSEKSECWIEVEKFLKKYDFPRYASQHWTEHFSRATVLDDRLITSTVVGKVYNTQSQGFRLWIHAQRQLDLPDYQFRILDWTGLMAASYFGHEVVVKQMLEQANLQTEFAVKTDECALSLAAAEGHETIVKLLLRRSNEALKYMSISLTLAAAKGLTAMVQLLLEAGADANSEVYAYWTPLLLAADRGHESIVKLLLAAGADVNFGGNQKETPLLFAAKRGRESIIKLLLEAGADVDSKDNYNKTPLHQAAIFGGVSVVKLLLEAGAEVDSRDCDDLTPLHKAAIFGRVSVVKLLLEAGAKVDSAKTKADKEGSLLSTIIRKGRKGMVGSLLDMGVSEAYFMKNFTLLISQAREPENAWKKEENYEEYDEEERYEENKEGSDEEENNEEGSEEEESGEEGSDEEESNAEEMYLKFRRAARRTYWAITSEGMVSILESHYLKCLNSTTSC